VALDAIPEPALEQIEHANGGTDLVIGMLGSTHTGNTASAVAIVHEVLGKLSNGTRVVLVVNDGQKGPAVEDVQSVPVLFCHLPMPDSSGGTSQNVSAAYHTVFGLSGRLGARACGVILSELQPVTAQWIYRLVQPALDMGFDLVAPRYARHKLEGLLNLSVLAPLHSALYGKKLQNPMGPDFGLSGNLMQQILGQDSESRRVNPSYPLASIASAAACGGFPVCESHLGVRTQPPTDWMNLSSLLAQVLGPVFLDMEHHAAYWQRIQGLQAVPRFGEPESVPEETGTVDRTRMIDSFQLGVKNLQDVWGCVLPPTSLLEIRKLSRQSADQFRMPEDLWASIVYDFALGHRLRTINRDHLLRSFTPLYLGWIASYTRELEAVGSAEIESRLAAAYETGKRSLVSRWRWPDRFSP
jgi:hypothetical protein